MKRKSRWTVRREKDVLGDLVEWPMSTTEDIAERLRLDPARVGRTIDTLLAERRVDAHWIKIPVIDRIAVLGFTRTHKDVCHWTLPGFDTQLDKLTADRPSEERS